MDGFGLLVVRYKSYVIVQHRETKTEGKDDGLWPVEMSTCAFSSESENLLKLMSNTRIEDKPLKQ